MEDFHFTGSVLIFTEEPGRYSELADREVDIGRFCCGSGIAKGYAAGRESRSARELSLCPQNPSER